MLTVDQQQSLTSQQPGTIETLGSSFNISSASFYLAREWMQGNKLLVSEQTQKTAQVLDDLKARNLYPSVEPPTQEVIGQYLYDIHRNTLPVTPGEYIDPQIFKSPIVACGGSLGCSEDSCLREVTVPERHRISPSLKQEHYNNLPDLHHAVREASVSALEKYSLIVHAHALLAAGFANHNIYSAPASPHNHTDLKAGEILVRDFKPAQGDNQEDRYVVSKQVESFILAKDPLVSTITLFNREWTPIVYDLKDEKAYGNGVSSESLNRALKDTLVVEATNMIVANNLQSTLGELRFTQNVPSGHTLITKEVISYDTPPDIVYEALLRLQLKQGMN